MPYTASLTEWTSKNFATAAKLVLITFLVGVVVLTLVWIHAENLWWILGTSFFFVGAISAIFGWVFYQHEKERRIYAESRAAQLEAMIVQLRLREPAAAQVHAPEAKKDVPFVIQTEPSLEHRELSLSEYEIRERFRKIWEEEQGISNGKNKRRPQVGYKQPAAESFTDWAKTYYVDANGQYRKRPGT